MLASTSRGALPGAFRPKQLPLRSLAAAAFPAAALGHRSSVAARLAQQLRELKQFKVRWTFRVCCPGYELVLPCAAVLCSAARAPTSACTSTACSLHSSQPTTCRLQVWDVSAAPSDRCNPAARGGCQLRPARQAAPSDGGARPGAGGGRRPGIVWFRGDLRLHDNEALSRAQVCACGAWHTA